MDFNNQDERMIITHYGENPEEYMNAVVPPIFMNSLHTFPTQEAFSNFNAEEEESYIYGRCSNPTVRFAEKKIAALENGKMALCFASGMAAATSAVMAVCSFGGHVICVRNAYDPLKTFLGQYCAKHMNISVSFVSGERVEEFESEIRENTQLIILESPSSIIFKLQDIRAVTALARRHGIRTYIDNSYCTPMFQKPLDMGVDLVMHTMSKYFGGHSDVIGGVLVSKDEELMKTIACDIREWFGGILGPMEGALVLRGLRTLQVRMEQHQKNAQAVAEFLESHPKVSKVNYPGLKSHPQYELMKRQQTGSGGLLSFEVKVSPQAAAAKITKDTFKVFQIGCSWGGFESLIIMPFYGMPEEETLRQYGASPGLIRIYCGLEGAENQIKDLERFLGEL